MARRWYIKNILHSTPEERRRICALVVPDSLLLRFGINRETFQDQQGRGRMEIVARDEGSLLNVRITNPDFVIDPIFSTFLRDADEDTLEVVGININNPQSQRFAIDLDEFGKITISMKRRNVEEEERAMRASLAPGQVRKGLGALKDFLRSLERFAGHVGADFLTGEALAYHNAILYEILGFRYHFSSIHEEMVWIDSEFRNPNGILSQRLDGSTPFRQPGFGKSARGRSWAVQDGILGYQWGRPMMVKEVGKRAGVRTFSVRPG